MNVSTSQGRAAAGLVMLANVVLAAAKMAAGILGHSYALVADGVESTLDVASSFIVWLGLRVSARPADRTHPYGHGKAESIASLAVCLLLMGAACGIAYRSVAEIIQPHHVPAPYTLVVLVIVVAVKEGFFRRLSRMGRALGSSALLSDAWHQRSDALTSLAAFVGISIALVGGERFASADAWAALFACVVIFWNGLRLLRHPLDEMMDAAVPQEIEREVRRVAEDTEGVLHAEKCRIRKSGARYIVDLHITVPSEISVQKGHELAHRVQDRLLAADTLRVGDVVIHVEPDTLGQSSQAAS